MITPDRAAEVLRLFHAEKWPIGTIAAQLALHHTTVRRVLVQAGVMAAERMPKPSIVDDFIPFIKEMLAKYPRLRASRLYAMARERGFAGGQDHFRHVVSRYRPRPHAEAYQRLRTLPGGQGQVDWAHFDNLTVGNAARPLWAFLMVLSFSRKLFLRFYFGSPCGRSYMGTSPGSRTSVACLGRSSMTTWKQRARPRAKSRHGARRRAPHGVIRTRTTWLCCKNDYGKDPLHRD